MKIIAVNPELTYFELIADSALTLPGRPTFIPDCREAVSWLAEPRIAIRISRLGKSIGPKFADRYFDAFTPAVRLLPSDAAGNVVTDIASIIDYALTIGNWADIPGEETAITFEPHGTCTISVAEAATAAVVSASRHTTLKTGDIILLPAPGLCATKAEPDRNVTATVNGELAMTVRFK